MLFRESSVILILATFCRFYQCYTVEVPYLKNGTSRPKLGHFSSVESFTNYTTNHDNSRGFLVNTPGCHIPDYTKNYKYAKNKYRGAKDPCGQRAVSLYNDIVKNKVTFLVNDTIMKIYSNDTRYSCCYKYAYKTAAFPGVGTYTKLHYTKCTAFRNGTSITRRYEIIRVICITQKNNEIYNDAFISVKRLGKYRTPLQMGENDTVWNVLLLGMSSMSRARLIDTMPATYKYLLLHNWLDYKGHTKVDAPTFPNLMAMLTGMNSSRVYDKCGTGLNKCADDFIWNKFNASGYKTAYGEDFLELPDVFSRHKGFLSKPTDHYMRPFYLIGENYEKNTLCTLMRPSASHLLDYAYNFADTYKHSQFFGYFWINSYTNAPTDNPSSLDNELASWLQKLEREGVLKRTFVIFFSDHGIRYGEMKLSMESYYEDRLPMLFMWVPHMFQKKFKQMYANMLLNQHRLTTPYDIYVTLGEILKLADSTSKGATSEACPECTGLFTLNSLFRTCADARLSQVWCVCHTMVEVKNNTVETNNSITLTMQYLNKVVNKIKTITCSECRPLKLHSIIRSHAFHSGSKTFHVIAFKTTHDVNFEATVAYRRDKSKIMLLRSLTHYNKKGQCARYLEDRPFCDCLMRCKSLFL